LRADCFLATNRRFETQKTPYVAARKAQEATRSFSIRREPGVLATAL